MAVPKTITLLTGETDGELVSALEERTGSHIRRLRLLGEAATPALSGEELDKLVADIQAAQGDKVMLIVTGNKVTVLPYQEQ